MVDIGKLNHDAIEAARRIVDNPTMQAVKALQENSVVSRLLADIERHEAFVRAAQGPLEELRRAGILDQTFAFHEQLRPVQEMMDAFNARFCLPEQLTTVKLMEEFQQSPVAEAMARYAAQADEIRRAIEAMHTPWLDAQETLRSVTGFVEIQGIGMMLERMPAFDDAVCAALRTDLGDWRDSITWPEPVLTDFTERVAFYRNLGFDPSLTDFPAPAFRESTKIAGLRREPPPLVTAYGEPVPHGESEEEEDAFVLTNKAHDWIQRLESHLRSFIDARMTEVFGPDWPKHQLPNGVYDEWKDRREAAVKAGREPKRLVAYADFTDYERVICKKDNWRQVFSRYFGRPESIRESFQRMHPIRLDTMHSRAIMQDDEMLLYVEVKRIIRVIVS